MSDTVRVLIADDHPLMRTALREAVVAYIHGAEIEEASSLMSLTEKLHAQPGVDLLLLDLRMPDAQGFSALVQIRTQFPEIPVVIVSAADDRESVNRAILLGAAGYIGKSAPLEVVGRSLREVLDGEIVVPTDFGKLDVFHEDDAVQFRRLRSLTPQQFNVLVLIAEGNSNKIVARRLEISESTVKAHITGILLKLGVQSRTQAAVLAQRALQLHALEPIEG